MKQSTQQNSPGIVKRSLSAHTWLGLAISALMYIICLSGTLAVFHHEMERWEQPHVEESLHFDYNQLEKAYQQFVSRYTEETSHMHVVFPTSGIPRLVVENDHIAHFVNADGGLGDIEASYWTKMLVNLHLYLHLPDNFGMILVSACGALLCGLILSGFLAHPRIIKDAFRFRRGGTGLQENIDLHNRMSVWAAPFHLMIGVTGAYFGLAGVVIVVISQAFYAGDNQAVVDKVFTPEPQLEQPLQTPQIIRAIKDVHKRSPDGELIFLTVHEPDTPGQFIEIYVKQPGRLIYSENYRYDIGGNFIATGGYKDGDPGSQVIYSLYRLHFGDFAGPLTKLLYFVLGMMLTVISATGINIWLTKRKTRDALNLVWPTIVWGTPVALLLSAIASLYITVSLAVIVWLSLVFMSVIAVRMNDEQRIKASLKRLLAVSCLVFLGLYLLKHGSAAFNIAALQINLPLLALAVTLLLTRDSKTETEHQQATAT